MLRKIYLSPLGRLISLILNGLAYFHRPFMIYGYSDQVSGVFRKRTRVSSTAWLGTREKISIADNVWIWHNSVIDGSNGVSIGEGVQIGAWCGVFSHGSHISIRLLGKHYIERQRENRVGYVGAPVVIGDYTFVGTGALIMPGSAIGKGCIIAPGSIVSGAIPDYSIAKGDPARVIGDTRDFDRRFFREASVFDSYYDREAAETILASFKNRKS